MNDTFSVSTIGEASASPMDITPDNEGEGPWRIQGGKRGEKRPRVTSTGSNNEIQQPKLQQKNHALQSVIFKAQGDRNLGNVNPVRIANEIHTKIGEIKQLKKSRGNVIVQLSGDKQIQKAIQIDTLCGIPVSGSLNIKQKQSQGVIHRVDKSIPDADLLDILKDQKVTSVRRFKKRVNGKLEETPSVLLTFDLESTPENVSFLFENYKVDKYVPQVVRCHKCQQFGHIEKYCKNNLKCVRCGGTHKYEECQKKEEPVCFRCGEKHSAAYKGCRFYKEAKSILSIKTTEKISYAQAAKQLKKQSSVPPKPTPSVPLVPQDVTPQITSAPQPQTQPIAISEPSSKSQPASNTKQPTKSQPVTTSTTKKQTSVKRKVHQSIAQSKPPQKATSKQATNGPTTSKDTLTFDAKDFLSFMVFIIKNLDNTANQSDKIKVIVDAAKDCLNIQNVKPEMLYDRFK